MITVKNLIKNCVLNIYNIIGRPTGSIGTQYVIGQGGHKLLDTI